MTRTLPAIAASLIAFSAAFVAVGPEIRARSGTREAQRRAPVQQRRLRLRDLPDHQRPDAGPLLQRSYTSDSHAPAAGTPCTTVGLARDAVARQVIQRQVTPSGSIYARCI